MKDIAADCYRDLAWLVARPEKNLLRGCQNQKVLQSLVLLLELKERQHFSRVMQWSEMTANLSTMRCCFSFTFSLVTPRKFFDQGKVISGAEYFANHI